ncbi:MAG: glutathione S-transferase family protein [Paracoccaceae bacterium]
MLTLLTYPGGPNSFSLSPFCVKSAMLLSYAGVPWQREDLTDPRKMPHQELPVLKTEKRLVPDSDGIRECLEQSGTDFDPGLNAVEKAQARALVRMAEEHLYFHVVQDRWANDRVWAVLRDKFFGSVPSLIRRPVSNGIRKSVLKGLGFQGTGRFSATERRDRIERDLRALSDLLKDRNFLLGDQISSADFSVAPVLLAMRETPARTELRDRVTSDPVFSAYLDRVSHAVPIK